MTNMRYAHNHHLSASPLFFFWGLVFHSFLHLQRFLQFQVTERLDNHLMYLIIFSLMLDNPDNNSLFMSSIATILALLQGVMSDSWFSEDLN